MDALATEREVAVERSRLVREAAAEVKDLRTVLNGVGGKQAFKGVLWSRPVKWVDGATVYKTAVVGVILTGVPITDSMTGHPAGDATEVILAGECHGLREALRVIPEGTCDQASLGTADNVLTSLETSVLAAQTIGVDDRRPHESWREYLERWAFDNEEDVEEITRAFDREKTRGARSDATIAMAIVAGFGWVR